LAEFLEAGRARALAFSIEALLIGGSGAARDLPQTGVARDDLVLGATSLSEAPCGF
jgi:hypothetical protein